MDAAIRRGDPGMSVDERCLDTLQYALCDDARAVDHHDIRLVRLKCLDHRSMIDAGDTLNDCGTESVWRPCRTGREWLLPGRQTLRFRMGAARAMKRT